MSSALGLGSRPTSSFGKCCGCVLEGCAQVVECTPCCHGLFNTGLPSSPSLSDVSAIKAFHNHDTQQPNWAAALPSSLDLADPTTVSDNQWVPLAGPPSLVEATNVPQQLPCPLPASQPVLTTTDEMSRMGVPAIDARDSANMDAAASMDAAAASMDAAAATVQPPPASTEQGRTEQGRTAMLAEGVQEPSLACEDVLSITRVQDKAPAAETTQQQQPMPPVPPAHAAKVLEWLTTTPHTEQSPPQTAWQHSEDVPLEVGGDSTESGSVF